MSKLNAVIICTLGLLIVGIAVGIGGPTMLNGFESIRVTGSSSATDTESSSTSGYGEELIQSAVGDSVLTLGFTPDTSVQDIGVYSPNQDTATMTTTRDVLNVTSITSSLGSDIPAAVASGTSVTVTGLQADEDRTLTLGFNYGTASAYTGLDTLVRGSPTLLVLGLIIIVAVVGFMGVKLSGRRE